MRTLRRAPTIAGLLLVLAVVAMPVPAAADESVNPRVQYRVDRITPNATGITASISPPILAHIAPQIVIANTTRQQLIVHGSDGVPMLRVGPDGTYGNVASAFLARALDPAGAAAGPGIAGASPGPTRSSGSPAWRQISKSATLRWYEIRAVYSGHGPKDPSKAVTLSTFAVPATLGTVDLRIEGSVRWRPFLGSIEPSITAVGPTITAVRVIVRSGPIPAVSLENRSDATITIFGPDFRPFARVGPRGVEVNTNSPTYTDTKSLPAATSTEPKWQKQQADPVLVWLERRAVFEGEPSPQVQAARTPTVVKRWGIAGSLVRSGSTVAEPFAIRGVSTWVPAPNPPPHQVAISPAVEERLLDAAIPAAIGVIAVIAGLLLARRIRRADRQ